MPRLTFIAIVFVALGVGVYFGLDKNRSDIQQSSASISEIALPDILNNIQQGKQWLGKVVVVNHWASWCPPCVEEIPLLITTQNRYQDQGLQVVGIAHDTTEATRIFGDQIGINYPSLVISSGGGELMKSQGSPQSSALPFTAIFNRHGKVARTKLGKLTPNELTQIVEELL